MPIRDKNKRIKENYTNDEIQRNFLSDSEYIKYLANEYNYKKLDAKEFMKEILKEGINKNLVQNEVDHTGKANGLIRVYSTKASKAKYFREKDKKGFVQVLKALAVNTKNINEINYKGLNTVYASTNLNFGHKSKKGYTSLTYLCNFDIDFDDVDFNSVMSAILNGDILKPTIITLTGTGVHLIYRLKDPVYCYRKEDVQKCLRIIKSLLAIKLLNNYISAEGIYDKAVPLLALSLNQLTRMPDSLTKYGETYVTSLKEGQKEEYQVKAYLIGESYAFEEIKEYVTKDLDYEEEFLLKEVNEINQNDKLKKELIKNHHELLNNLNTINSVQKQKLFMGKYKHIKRGLYDGWLKKIKKAITDGILNEGRRYYSIFVLACAARKGNVPYEELKKDAFEIQKMYQKIDGSSAFTTSDVINAINTYFDEKSLTYTGKFLMTTLLNLPITHHKRNGRTTKEHIQYLKENHLITGRTAKRKMVKKFFKKLIKLGLTPETISVRELEKLAKKYKYDVKKSRLANYKKELLNEIRNEESKKKEPTVKKNSENVGFLRMACVQKENILYCPAFDMKELQGNFALFYNKLNDFFIDLENNSYKLNNFYEGLLEKHLPNLRNLGFYDHFFLKPLKNSKIKRLNSYYNDLNFYTFKEVFLSVQKKLNKDIFVFDKFLTSLINKITLAKNNYKYYNRLHIKTLGLSLDKYKIMAKKLKYFKKIRQNLISFYDIFTKIDNKDAFFVTIVLWIVGEKIDDLSLKIKSLYEDFYSKINENIKNEHFYELKSYLNYLKNKASSIYNFDKTSIKITEFKKGKNKIMIDLKKEELIKECLKKREMLIGVLKSLKDLVMEKCQKDFLVQMTIEKYNKCCDFLAKAFENAKLSQDDFKTVMTENDDLKDEGILLDETSLDLNNDALTTEGLFDDND